jgi:hypothetical protein
MKDESEAPASDKKTTTGRKGKSPGSSKKQTGKNEKSENSDPAKNNVDLSEDEESADDKPNDATTKKGPTKRSAPSSDNKTGTTTGKKRSAEDEPFDDRTMKMIVQMLNLILKMMVHQLNKPKKVVKLHHQLVKQPIVQPKKPKPIKQKLNHHH